MSRILILNLGVRGGSSIYAKEIIDRLKDDIFVVNAKHSSVPIPNRINQYWRCHKNPKEFLVYSIFLLPIYSIKLTYWLMINRFSVLYLPYIHFWSPVFISLFKVFNKRVVVTVHDGVSHSKNGFPLIQRMVNFCIRRADKIIFLTNHVKEETLNKLKVGKDVESYVIPHGLISPIGLSLSKREPSEEPNILFFGRVIKSKGVDLLLQAISEIDEKLYDRVTIVGKHYYKLNIPDSLVRSKVNIIDSFISEKEISEYFNKSHILVLPYLEASQSGVLTIGIAAGIPMIVTKVGGLSEQLSENVDAVYINPDKEELKNALVSLLSDRDKYNYFVTNMEKRRESLSWDRITESIQSVINP